MKGKGQRVCGGGSGRGGEGRGEVQSKFKTVIIIQQGNKKRGTMIYSQNAQLGNLGFYPYFFSTNIESNCYNYFAHTIAPYLPPLPSNIVYAPPLALPTSFPPKNVPLHSQNFTNCSELPETPAPLNNFQAQEEEVLRLTNRNVLPNNVSLVLCFIRRVKKSGRMVQRILARLAPEEGFSSKRFYAYQHYLKENCTDFKWKEGIEVLATRIDPNCPSFTIQEQALYNKVTRVLIVEYLEEICRLEVLNHTKINPTHIRDHLRVIRYIRESLRGESKPRTTIQYM